MNIIFSAFFNKMYNIAKKKTSPPLDLTIQDSPNDYFYRMEKSCEVHPYWKIPLLF